MGKEFGPFSHEVISSPQEISCCSHLSGIGISLRDHATSEQGSDFMGIDLIVFGFSSVDGFHVEGVT